MTANYRETRHTISLSRQGVEIFQLEAVTAIVDVTTSDYGYDLIEFRIGSAIIGPDDGLFQVLLDALDEGEIVDQLQAQDLQP